MTDNTWQVLCSKDSVIERNKLYKLIREFFEARDVLEVETPLLSRATVTDPFINSFEVFEPCRGGKHKINKFYLQTSPEFAMKRLLCSGFDSIFQICKSFRAEEQGANHNCEFTMLEWYRIGFKLDDLMGEMAELLCLILNKPNDSANINYIAYNDLFLNYLGFNHNLVDSDYLKNKIQSIFGNKYNNVLDNHLSKDDLLMILLSDYIEPQFDKNKIIFLYDYPATQAALARLDTTGDYPVAKRFEVYIGGLELANGFYELADHKEQERRFTQDLAKREKLGLPQPTKDQNLLSALKQGLPECSGVALGLDRLLMVKLGMACINEVITFGP